MMRLPPPPPLDEAAAGATAVSAGGISNASSSCSTAPASTSAATHVSTEASLSARRESVRPAATRVKWHSAPETVTWHLRQSTERDGSGGADESACVA
eukprot:4667131-Prymnesium_polylepis.1